MNACAACRQRKRKCDRARPSCSTCVRTARICIYDDVIDLYRFVPDVDPFQHQELRQPTVNVAVRREAIKIFGSLDRVPGIVENYFGTVHQRLSILSKKRFMDRLTVNLTGASADYIALCLVMHLVQQLPESSVRSMQTSLYVAVKSILSMLMATASNSLNVLQAWILIAFYELGHAIFPACSVSIASCVKLLRWLDLYDISKIEEDVQVVGIEKEEQKRVCWSVRKFESFINLCEGDALFATLDPKSNSPLPVEDAKWFEDIVPETHHTTLATPSSISVGAMARECQVSYLASRVVRHVFEPTSDQNFQREEELQLEKTIMSFIPILLEEESAFGRHCAALGISSSALFTLYNFAPTNTPEQKLKAMEPLSTQIVGLSAHLFGDLELVDIELMSPFVTHSLYQSAVVQLRLWKVTGESIFGENLESLKRVLGHFNRRWLIAGKYITALEDDWPEVLIPFNGLPI